MLRQIWNHKIRTLLVVAGVIIIGLIIKNLLAPEKYAESTKVIKKDLVDTVNAQGTVQAKESANLYFGTLGKVAWVGVKKGDVVRKYQTLASLDRRSVEESRKKALLDFKSARYTFEQIHDDYNTEGRTIEKVPNLSDKDKRVLEQAQLELDKAITAVNLSSLSMENLSISSPIAGIVTEDSGLRNGTLLSSADLGQKYFRVVNPNSVFFRAEIDEVDLGKIKNGMETKITLDTYPSKEWMGNIAYISHEAIKNNSGSVKIYAEIPFKEAAEIVPNLNGEVRIFTNRKENVLSLPKKYVTSKEGKSTVLVRSGKKLTSREIKTGLMTSEEVEIIDGLAEGEEVFVK